MHLPHDGGEAMYLYAILFILVYMCSILYNEHVFYNGTYNLYPVAHHIECQKNCTISHVFFNVHMILLSFAWCCWEGLTFSEIMYKIESCIKVSYYHVKNKLNIFRVTYGTYFLYVLM